MNCHDFHSISFNAAQSRECKENFYAQHTLDQLRMEWNEQMNAKTEMNEQ